MILGIRRCGESTILKQITQLLENRNVNNLSLVLVKDSFPKYVLSLDIGFEFQIRGRMDESH